MSARFTNLSGIYSSFIYYICLSFSWRVFFDFAFPFTSTNDWFYRNHHTFLPEYLMFSGIVSSAHPEPYAIDLRIYQNLRKLFITFLNLNKFRILNLVTNEHYIYIYICSIFWSRILKCGKIWKNFKTALNFFGMVVVEMNLKSKKMTIRGDISSGRWWLSDGQVG